MRLYQLRARGFRAFSAPIEVDLDADVVVLAGPNGQGKTSLLDGILWALSGCISRFKGSSEDVVSLYSQTGEAEVEVDIGSGQQRWTIRRAWDGHAQRLHVSGPSGAWSGREAAIELTRLMRIPEPPTSTPDLGAPALHTAITRAIYLQQDLVREFVEADDETSRYENLSQLFGTRRVVDLQVELERQKSNWSRRITTDRKDAASVDKELSRLEEEIEALEEGGGQPTSSDDWVEWWQSFETTCNGEDAPPEMSSSEAPVVLDRALRVVESDKRRIERRLAALDELMSDVSRLDENTAEGTFLDELRAAVQASEQKKGELDDHLQSAEVALTESRREAARRHDTAEDRALFAKLALRHLNDTCPICQQTYDRRMTEERLEALASSAESNGPELPDTAHVDGLRGELRTAEEALALARRQLEIASEERRKVKLLKDRLQDAQVLDVAEAPAREWSSLLSDRCKSMRELVAHLRRLQEEGEKLSLAIARANEAARLEALRSEREALLLRRNELERDLQAREETGSVAQEMIEGLRGASQEIVSRELNRVRPMAQRVYSAINPHPALRRIDISATMFGGRGRVRTSVNDPETSAVSERPEHVLSSSQLNALALSLFLALNVGSRDLPLHSLILDDPLQSLDDINLLGLVDLLRRLADSRQMIVSTHDARFASVLERKLRPVRPEGRTISISVDSWSREGPTIRVREVARPQELFVVA